MCVTQVWYNSFEWQVGMVGGEFGARILSLSLYLSHPTRGKRVKRGFTKLIDINDAAK